LRERPPNLEIRTSVLLDRRGSGRQSSYLPPDKGSNRGSENGVPCAALAGHSLNVRRVISRPMHVSVLPVDWYTPRCNGLSRDRRVVDPASMRTRADLRSEGPSPTRR